MFSLKKKKKESKIIRGKKSNCLNPFVQSVVLKTLCSKDDMLVCNGVGKNPTTLPIPVELIQDSQFLLQTSLLYNMFSPSFSPCLPPSPSHVQAFFFLSLEQNLHVKYTDVNADEMF